MGILPHDKRPTAALNIEIALPARAIEAASKLLLAKTGVSV